MKCATVVSLCCVLTLLHCKQFSEVKVSDLRKTSMQHKLWQKLIGRQMTTAEHREYAHLSYEQALTKMLASQVYIDEGFFHLHRQRLLLHYFDSNSYLGGKSDYQTLRMELADVARADNYWDILTYRDRWLVEYLLDLPPKCKDYLVNKTAANMQACSDGHEYERFGKKINKEGLHQLFFAAAQPIGQQSDAQIMNYQDTTLCAGTNSSAKQAQIYRGYQRLFGQDFCSQGELQPNWSEEDLAFAINLYVSMQASQKLDFLLELAIIDTHKTIEIEGSEEYETYYFKVRFPDHDNDRYDLHGIHANMFWLTKFSTKPLNQHLHRAKIIWYSWFCQHIAPDNARMPLPKDVDDMTEDEKKQWNKFQNDIAAVQDYFAVDDTHTKADQLCFNCHRNIQPVANYFGRLSMRNMETLNSDIPDYFEYANPHDRLGGFWQTDKDSFMPASQGAGLPALASLLSNLPAVRSCIVKASWNHFFGSDYALQETEIAVGVAVFEQQNFNYRALLKHLLTTPEAKAYFVEGEQKFHQLRDSKSLDCATAKAKGNIDAVTIVKNSCDNCHLDEYVDTFVNEEQITRLEDIQRAVFDEARMPQGDNFAPLAGLSQAQANDVQRKILQCHLEASLTTEPRDEKEEQKKLAQQGHLVNGKEMQP